MDEFGAIVTVRVTCLYL